MYREPFFMGTIPIKQWMDQSTKTSREMIRWSLKCMMTEYVPALGRLLRKYVYEFVPTTMCT